MKDLDVLTSMQLFLVERRLARRLACILLPLYLQMCFFFQNYQLISKSVAEEWALMETDLTRERGLWGPASSSQLDKWALDMVEGNSVQKIISPYGIQVLLNRYVLRIQ